MASFRSRLLAARRLPNATTAARAKRDVVADARAYFGVEPHHQLRTFLELPPTGWRDFGNWRPSMPSLPTERSSLVNVFESAFAHAPSLVSSFTNTISIGRDGGGQEYLVEVSPTSSAVYLFGPGVGELKFLADSFDSFLALNELAEVWTAYERRHGIDFGDIEDGSIDPKTLRIDAIHRGMEKLASHVCLTGYRQSDLASDFDEIFPMLTGIRPRAQPASLLVQRLHRRSYWVQMNLRIRPGYLPGETLGLHGTKGLPPAKSATTADVVYRLWNAFLTSQKDTLASECGRAKDSPSLLVRRTSELLEAIAQRRATPPALKHLAEFPRIITKTLKKAAPSASA